MKKMVHFHVDHKTMVYVNASAKTLNNDDEFSHLIEHAVASTLEER